MRRIISVSSIAFLLVILTYSVISKLIFDRIYITSKQVIDEEFHIPQGLAYCNFHFDTWNPKITTLPGLYLISSLLLAPWDLCLIYWLRAVNLGASVLNLVLFYVLVDTYNKKAEWWKTLISTVNLALLPPLYFFSHLYYTDTLSMSFILLILILEKKERHILASIAGMLSIVMRQTNIIWVLMVFGRYVLIQTFHNSLKRRIRNKTERKISEEDLKELNKGVVLRNFSLEVWLNIASYSAVIVSFLSFILWNGGIVIGDKAAHVAAIHIPQIFYFALFTFVFMWPYFIPKLRMFVKAAIKRKFVIIVVAIVFAIIVCYNTLVHPYLLADNRHYTFYVWNRSYGKYHITRYIMVFPYLYFLYCMWSVIYCRNDISFAAVYIPCTCLVLTLQKMIEVRYFFVPYVLIRLQVKDACFKQLLCEFVYLCIINYLTLNVFFNKNIYWVDYIHPQKLLW